MFKTSVLRQATRAVRTNRPATTSFVKSAAPALSERSFHSTSLRRKDDAERNVESEENSQHAGTFSRTDNTIQVQYPPEEELPSSKPVQGRGGYHFKRTLASFSLEGNVGLVTGGALSLIHI